MASISIGLSGEKTTTVAEEQTARHLGSGGIDVFATPAMIALMEGAAVNALDHLLADKQASVGIEIAIKHLAATPLGHTVRARAEVTAVDDRQIHFKVEAWDEAEKIGEGTHTRFIIDVERFKGRLEKK
ncbi:MAG: thioesterase family protein [Chloroflexi bacterium]|nr:thioesterase family protein [Chloroflexota bacterium]